ELSPTLRNLLLEKINDDDEEIQMGSINLLQEKNLAIPLEELLRALYREPKQNVIWALVKTIADKYDPRIVALAKQWKNRENFKRIYGCYLLVAIQQPTTSQQNLAIIMSNTNHADPQMRLACAQVLGELSSIDLKGALELLMHDSDLQVSIQAK